LSTDLETSSERRRFPRTILTAELPHSQSFCGRRRVLGSIWHTFLPSFFLIDAATAVSLVETIGKDPNCNDAFCLGVWDGLLAVCPHPSKTMAGCVSSQDDTPSTFAEPWDYSEEVTLESLSETDRESTLMQRLFDAMHQVSNRRGDLVETILRQGRYLHVLFTDGNSKEISHGEFYITPNDTTIQFRLCSMGNISGPFTSPSLKNMDRAELIRKELHFLKLPILRNRQRSFLFLESDFDSFGPRSAALGPPEEMKRLDQP
jgi:uncharacterized protein (DUF1499 family)